MSPVTITAKRFMQSLWKQKAQWDEQLPGELYTQWIAFREGLRSLSNICIPRHIFAGKVPKNSQLHVFCDASMIGYGAVIYVRSILDDGTVITRLLCARSRITPPKPITIPRLELTAAKMGAELWKRVITDLRLQDVKSTFWTDSLIVIQWIRSEASSYHTFVANRIAAIQDLTPPSQWRHVPSEQNPADLVSRGISPEKLKNSTIWFYGPMFLHGEEKMWPTTLLSGSAELEKREKQIVLALSESSVNFIHHINHGNSLHRLLRIVAYVLRFSRNARPKSKGPSSSNNHNNAFLSVVDIEGALSIVIRAAQQDEFKAEIHQLNTMKQVKNNSPISSLNPMLDKNGIIRVGGRLEESLLSYDAKHPIVLPYSHFITKLIMTDLHTLNLHAGPQALLAITRQKYWPIKGKTTARTIVGQCVRCAKAKPKLLNQLMGNLPADRVQPSRPFINVGVDFAGPFWIHFKLRGKRPQKAYIAIFCCFATKAVHIEVVSDLTTNAFIAALKRFIGRRGNCRKIYCDNATNFVGARNQLSELKDIMQERTSQERIISLCLKKGMDFQFIPPRAPHFGGIWEAAVKSAKYLLNRHVTPASLTYEELETVMIEVESILNSRPLTPMSSNPNDLNVLSPGHFLIGEPLTSTIDADASENKSSLSQRWKQIVDIRHKFWQRWSHEYLSELQHRHKWKSQHVNIRPGMMVLVKDDNLPVLKWQMGRILHDIHGKDGVARVADVKTASGTIRRPIHKLAPLPIATDETPDDSAEASSLTKRSNIDGNINIEPQPSTSPPCKKRLCFGGGLMSLLLVASLILPISCNDNFKIIPFHSPPGIYFERLGTLDLALNEWKLVVYFDMRTYWQEGDVLKSELHDLNELCSSFSEKSLCTPIISQLTNLQAELDDNNKIFLHSIEQHQRRTKRGALNIVGNMAGALFGVLDSEYADKMTATITTLQENDDRLLQLIKNQTSIVDATVNVIQRSERKLKKQLQLFNNFMNTTIENSNKILQLLNEQKKFQAFLAMAMQSIMISHEYQRIQSDLLDLLIDAHHGKVNPQILSPQQLQTQVTLIKDHLPQLLSLPVTRDNLLDIYKIMTIQSHMSPDRIIFQLKIPLVTRDRFELLHVVPVPVINNGSAMTVEISTKFLSINLHRDYYYALTEQELAACFAGPNQSFICKQNHPLHRIGSKENACELSFFTPNSQLEHCTLRATSEPPRYTQLLNNQWIYFVKEETTINIVCKTSVFQGTLNGSGIVQLKNHCAIKEPSTTIQAHDVLPSFVSSSITLSRSISNLLQPSTTKFPLIQSITDRTALEELQYLKSRISDLKAKEQLHQDRLSLDIHHFSIGYLSLILAISVIIFILITRIRKARKNKTPIPKPRTMTFEEIGLSTIAQEGGGC